MRDMIIKALKQHYLGEIAKQKANVEIFLSSHVGVGEHPDVLATIDGMVGQIAELDDKIQAIDMHFNNSTPRI